MGEAEVELQQESGAEEEITSDIVSGIAADEKDYSRWPEFRFDVNPRRVYHFHKQFRDKTRRANNFLKGVKWSPDGSSFLTSSDDDSLRLFFLPETSDYGVLPEADLNSIDAFDSNVIVWEAESVYDYCWYPFMSVQDPTSCVFASTSRDHPIHLWDAISGQLRGTYRAYDAMDEITAAISVSFNSSGTKLFAGYNKCIRIFDIHCPGRDFEQRSTVNGKEGISGIISSIGFSPANNGMLALGSFNQKTAVYAEGNMELLFVLHGQEGGVTQVLFSKDGNYLFTGGRKDPYILCWDLRYTADVIYKLYRSAESTNQRISFDIEPCGRHLGTGGQDGLVHFYDLQTGQWVSGFQAAQDTVNGFSFHPSLPLAACSSGHRRFSSLEDADEFLSLKCDENCASIWQFANVSQSILTDGIDQ